MFELDGVSKRFGHFLAVDHMTFSVKCGEVLGFLGANGAGKSTTMRMLTGYLRPDGGKIIVGGHDMSTDGVQARAAIGYLPENAPVYGDMTVEEFLRYCGRLRGLCGTALTSGLSKVLELCSLEGVRRQRIATLSKGYTHRTCLAQALIHEPKGLVMDEPTDGLDPAQKREVQGLIREMGKKRAIIVSTHILDEVEAMCTRVVIIDHGRLCLDVPIEQVRGHLFECFESACRQEAKA